MPDSTDMNLAPPTATGVLVIGGGVVGVSTALFLAERGVDVTLCEKGRVAGEQSSRNWGWIRRQGRELAELPLMGESLALWTRVAGELDEDIGFRTGGVTYLAETDEELAVRADWLERVREFELGTRLLDAGETARMLGRNDLRFRGALHTPDDAFAEPALAVPAMARLARTRGAKIVEGLAVRGLLREAGRVRGAVTERGTIRADAVVLAGGIWSRTMLENEGSSLPQLAVRSSALRTTAAPRTASGTFGAAGASIRPRADGGYTIGRAGAARFDMIPAGFRHMGAFLPLLRSRWRIMTLRAGRAYFGPLGHHRWEADEPSPFEAVRTMDPAADPRLLADVLARARELYPALRDARIAESWAGLIDVMPDEIPVIDHVDALPGLVLATGMSGHGFGLGPGAGLLAGQLATGTTPIVDPSAFSLARFARAGVGARQRAA